MNKDADPTDSMTVTTKPEINVFNVPAANSQQLAGGCQPATGSRQSAISRQQTADSRQQLCSNHQPDRWYIDLSN